MHSIYNHRVEIDTDGINGRGEAYCVTHLFEEESRMLATWYGRYQDTYECRDGEWRIAHRICVHHSNTSEHVPDTMGIDASLFRQASFDRAGRRPTSGSLMPAFAKHRAAEDPTGFALVDATREYTWSEGRSGRSIAVPAGCWTQARAVRLATHIESPVFAENAGRNSARTPRWSARRCLDGAGQFSSHRL